VNAAFLLVATALVTGSDPVQAVPAPAAPAIVSGCSSCNSGCNTCDSCGHTKLFGGFRGLFNRGSNCGCDSCGSKKLFSGFGSGCGCGGGFSLGLKERFSGFGHKSCDTCNTCAQEKSCGCGIMESPLSRLGGLFRKKSCGCATETCNSCSSCGSTGAVIQGAPVAPVPAGAAPAPATAPKPMPAPPAKPVGGQLTPTSQLIIE
jgi:hypothetical protein